MKTDAQLVVTILIHKQRSISKLAVQKRVNLSKILAGQSGFTNDEPCICSVGQGSIISIIYGNNEKE